MTRTLHCMVLDRLLDAQFPDARPPLAFPTAFVMCVIGERGDDNLEHVCTYALDVDPAYQAVPSHAMPSHAMRRDAMRCDGCDGCDATIALF